MNKVKNMWYDEERRLLADGYHVSINGKTCKTEIFESFIPPLLRFFHISNMSPSGWIGLPKNKTLCISSDEKTTHCDYEFELLFRDIVPLREKEDRVPFKIMSFDIEASSSHGDFPVPIKTYKKLATNVIDILNKLDDIQLEPDELIRYSVLHGFKMLNHDTIEYDEEDDKKIIMNLFNTYVDTEYPKKAPTLKNIENALKKIMSHEIDDVNQVPVSTENTIMQSFENASKHVDEADTGNFNHTGEEDDCGDDDGETKSQAHVKRIALKGTGKKIANTKNKTSVSELINSQSTTRELKINHLTEIFGSYLPSVEGDKVTFIGSTFLTYGEKKPNYNHCIVLDTCDDLGIENTDIESYDTEQKVLLAWRDLVIRENPDIIIGYNIFGFDYNVFLRAQETGCASKFIEISKLKDHMCGTFDETTGRYDIEHSSITLQVERMILATSRCQVVFN